MTKTTLRTTSRRSKDRNIKADRDSVQAVARAVELLELLADNGEGLRLVDIAQKSGMATSTAHRLLTTLEARHFVAFDKQNRAWNIGGHCFRVGAAFGRRRRLAEIAEPIMRRLVARSRQTVNLGVADAETMTLLCQTVGHDAPGGLAQPGSQSAITRTALGQSVMAALPDAQIDIMLRSVSFESGRGSGHGQLAAMIRAARGQRFAIDDEINAAGLRCVAAPIFDEFARPIAALSVAGGTRHIDLADLGEIGRSVIAAAGDITQAIGGCAPGWTMRAASINH